MDSEQKEVGRDLIQELKAKIERLNIVCRNIEPRHFHLISELVSRIYSHREDSEAEDSSLENETVNALYRQNIKLEQANLNQLKALSSAKQKISARRVQHNFEQVESNFKSMYEEERRFVAMLEQKYRELSRKYNDWSVKLNGLNSDDLLANKEYCEFNRTNLKNHCYKKVLEGELRPPPVAMIELVESESADGRFRSTDQFLSQIEESRALKQQVVHLQYKMQLKKEEIGKLQAKLSEVTYCTKKSIQKLAIESLVEQRDCLLAQLQLVAKFVKSEKEPSSQSTRSMHKGVPSSRSFHNQKIKAHL